MLHLHRGPIVVAVAVALFDTSSTYAEEGDVPGLNAYPASYFEKAQPYSAFDMLALLPGYTFIEADPDVRGFAASAGNVLIDGDRPATKHESLENLLRRIPASGVERIELIRSGAHGVQMQGQTVLANVVRVRRGQMHGAFELASTRYAGGIVGPRIAGELSRGIDRRLLELSAASYEALGDEHGDGHQARAAPDGAVLESAQYSQDERERSAEVSAAYEQQFEHGKLRANGSYIRETSDIAISEEQTHPDRETENVRERERQSESELGVRYDYAFDDTVHLELIGLHRTVREKETEDEIQVDETSSFRQVSSSSESIVRGVSRRLMDRWTLEFGAEAARNVLDSRSALRENDAPVALPAADVRVEERRSEAFVTTTWRMNAQWTLEAGSHVEVSELHQEGDSAVRKSFFYPKPRVLLSFAPTHANQWRLLIERSVGQLDFEDFVSSTSLSVDTVTAGNPDLEPDRTWTAELSWEHRLLDSGSLVLTARREKISDLIDRVPVDRVALLDGVGNIGEGERDELEIGFTMPLAPLGLDSGLLKTTALWRRSRAIDPVTGEQREISEEAPFEGALQFSHDLPALKVHWGVNVELATETREFLIDEIRAERFGARVDVFAEYEPAPAWNIRFFANNLTDRTFERERRIYDGARDVAPLSYVETRTLRMGPYIGVSVRRSFGR